MTIEDLIVAVRTKFANNEFDKFIHTMHFPKFKNFAPGAKIECRFPITVLVGPNGGGKSSILQAAWGMPLGSSTSRFWFSTPVDPIDFDGPDQNRYWYSHFVAALGRTVQSRKMCGRKRNGYWEPTRPARREGMEPMPIKDAINSPFMSDSGDRWSQVVRTPHYINAKAESSAFDRFFYSSTVATLDAKQDYFVRYSRQLKRIIDGNLTKHEYYGKERVSANFLLSPKQLAVVNSILEKKYKSARYVSHCLYDKNFSPSVIFETSRRSYSECFAGSGELAIVNCVLALDRLSKFDLLLLDEPETSLHPGAQIKLIEHILQLVNEKQIQVLVSTHSAEFVKALPVEALVVLDESPAGISPRVQPSKASAFQRLGQIDKDRITILTEDKLLKAMVERAVSQLPKELTKKIDVVAANVGASEMLSNQTRAYAQTNAKTIMVFDGDQAEVQRIFLQNPDDLSAAQQTQAIKKLKNLHVSVVGKDLLAWMRWCKEHVVLIEQICPEQALLTLLTPGHALLADPNATNKEFKKIVRNELQESKDDYTSEAQAVLLKRELGKADPDSVLSKSIQALAQLVKDKMVQFE